MNICKFFHDQAALRPASAAIIDVARGRERVTTFAELEARSSGAAVWLRGRPGGQAIGKGDVVLVTLPMSTELYVVLLALFRIEAMAMFLDPSAGLKHIKECCDLEPPRAWIAGSRAQLLWLASPALRKIPIRVVSGTPLPFFRRLRSSTSSTPSTIPDTSPETPALLTFTSGSTGQPKGAIRTHGFLLNQHRILASNLELTSGDIDLTTMPIVLLANLGSGVTSIIPAADLSRPGSVDAKSIIAQIQKHQIASSTASPAFFDRLIRHAHQQDIQVASLRKLFSGGAPVFPRLLAGLQEMAPEAEVVAVYGSTEAEPIAHVAHRDLRPQDIQDMLKGKGLFTGAPVKDIDLRILRNQWGKPVGPYSKDEFELECMPAGEKGEIVVTGEHVIKGYLHGHGDEETKFRVGDDVWHRTGDAGFLDPKGGLWLSGRCVGRIVDDKGELYPFAVECAAQEHPNVRRAALSATQGRRLLVIEGYSDMPPPDLKAISSALTWARLDEVLIVRTIPVDKRHNAKVDYPALRRMLGIKTD